MVFSESQLMTDISYDFLNEADNILGEAITLDPYSATLSPVAVPVVENASIDRPVVHYNDIVRLSEENSVSYGASMIMIAEANNIDPDNLVVSIPDYEITANPSIVNEMYNVTIIPTTSDDIVYTYMEACMDCFLETGDEDFLYSMADDRIILGEAKTVAIKDANGKVIRYEEQKGVTAKQFAAGQNTLQANAEARKKDILAKETTVKRKGADGKMHDVKKNDYVLNKRDSVVSMLLGNKPGTPLKSSQKKLLQTQNLASNPDLAGKIEDVLRKSDYGRKPYEINGDKFLISPKAAQDLNSLLTAATNKAGKKGITAPTGGKTLKDLPDGEKRLADVRARQAARQAAAANAEEKAAEKAAEKDEEQAQAPAAEEPATAAVKDVVENNSDSAADAKKKLSMFQNIKNTLINKPRTFLARKLQWLRNWAEQHLSSLPTENRSIWQKIKAKVYEIINWITNKLGTTKGGNEKDIDYTYNKDYDA